MRSTCDPGRIVDGLPAASTTIRPGRLSLASRRAASIAGVSRVTVGYGAASSPARTARPPAAHCATHRQPGLNTLPARLTPDGLRAAHRLHPGPTWAVPGNR